MDPAPPLAIDKRGKPIELPEAAEAWAVYRLPGGAGGRPGRVIRKGMQLSVELDTTPAELLTLVESPGRYKLRAVDEDENDLGIHVWVDLEGEEALTPSPQSATEGSLIAALRSSHETIIDMAQAMSGLVRNVLPDRVRHGVTPDGETVTLEAVTEDPNALAAIIKENGGLAGLVGDLVKLSPTIVENMPHLRTLVQMLKSSKTPAAPANGATGAA